MIAIRFVACLVLAAVGTAIAAEHAQGQAGAIERVSIATSRIQSNDRSDSPEISADGRFVAFSSPASNLVPGDTNQSWDVFVRDQQTGMMQRVSLASDGSEGNGNSSSASLSRDGRLVAFSSAAANLVPGDANGFNDLFVRDRETGTTERVSVANDGSQANEVSFNHWLSADGRFVAFVSFAGNLVPGDTNGETDVFLRDRQARTTERISVAADGAQASGPSFTVSVSADGRFVAFVSASPDLVADDTNGVGDVFVRDRQTGAVERIMAAAGAQPNGSSRFPSISADGRLVAFHSEAANLVAGDTNGVEDVFVHDRATQSTERVSVATDGTQAGQPSFNLAFSADGRFAAFASESPDLIPGDNNGATDVFIHDRRTRTTERISIAADGAEASGGSFAVALSGDGRWAVFASDSPDLVPDDTNGTTDTFVRDRQTGTTERVSVGTGGAQADGASADAALSAEGHVVAFASEATNLVPGDTNAVADVFVRERSAGTTERVAVAADGGQADGGSGAPSLSADGQFVAFESVATNLVADDTNGTSDVFLRDRQARTNERVSLATAGAQANGGSFSPSLSADGRFVAFASLADNLAPGDTNGASDVFLRDRRVGTTERLSVTTGGSQASGHSLAPSLSADGRFVAFESTAADLVAGDTNGAIDVFLRDRVAGTTERVSVTNDGSEADRGGSFASLSADGRFVAFASDATNLVAADTNRAFDVFVRERTAGKTERVSVAPGTAEAGGGSHSPSLASGDGRFVAFVSAADNLVPGDINGARDVFVRDRVAGTTGRVPGAGPQADGHSDAPALSTDGRFLAFVSSASNLVPGDTNDVADVFVQTR